MDVLLKIVDTINSFLSDYVLFILLISVGVWFTIRTRFVQIRCFGEGFKRLFGGVKGHKNKQKGGMSSFQALATAIAAQIGTGNIVGASAAILTGGPGAIFWMWIIAFFGMSTMYAEAVLAQETRIVKENGEVLGGPVYYIKKAFPGKFGKILATFFAVALVIAVGFCGGTVQANSIGSVVNTAFGVPTWVVGIVLAVICVIVFIGGVKRLASVVEKLVPIMAIMFIFGTIMMLVINITKVPEAFGLIFKYAFTPQAIIGGTFGAAIKIAITQGAKRGLFSNEAGMGSTPHAHALANVENPHAQGTVAMTGVFIDTFVVLTLNALVIITTMYTEGGILSGGIIPDTIDKTNLTQTAFGTTFGSEMGNIFVAVCLFFFAFSTILSWNMFGRLNFIYLFGKKGEIIYTIISVGFIVAGTLMSSDLVWGLQDLFNQLMVLPNVIALFALTGLVLQVLKKYKKGKKKDLEVQSAEESSDQPDKESAEESVPQETK